LDALKPEESRVAAGFQKSYAELPSRVEKLSASALRARSFPVAQFPVEQPHFLWNQLSIFSHSNPEFCHPKFRTIHYEDAPEFMNRTCIKSAAGKLEKLQLVDAAIGGAICAIAAIVASLVAYGHSWNTLVPLVFTVILLLNARLFGTRAGLLGTVLAALVFAGWLFGPVGSIDVANDSARANLGWMLLIGIGFSFLFAPPTSGFRRH
jgi:hypothetical protein